MTTERTQGWAVWILPFHAHSWNDAEEILFGAQYQRGFTERRLWDGILPRGVASPTSTRTVKRDSPRWMPEWLSGHSHEFRGEYVFVRRIRRGWRVVEWVQTYHLEPNLVAALVGFSDGEAPNPLNLTEGPLAPILKASAEAAIDALPHGPEKAAAAAAIGALAGAMEVVGSEMASAHAGYVAMPPVDLRDYCFDLAAALCDCSNLTSYVANSVAGGASNRK
jgi:hypothetical protein